MTTATVIIQAAYREGNLIPAGTDPTTAEQTEALERFNRLLQGMLGYDISENFADWLVPAPQRTAVQAANYPQGPAFIGADSSVPFGPAASNAVWPYPPKSSRLVFGAVDATVYFPEAPDDGSRMALVQGSGAGDDGSDGQVITLDGNGRTIEGADTQDYTAPVTKRQWLYRADLGDWVAIVDMALTDEVPFPTEMDDLWITALAIRLAPRYTKGISAETAATYKNMKSTFKARYRQAQVTTYGSTQIPGSYQSYVSRNWQL